MTAPLDVAAFAGRVDLPDEAAADAARARQRQLIKPAGALGRLEELSVWIAGVQGRCPPRDFVRARVVLFAGDHGVARTGLSAYPPDSTARLLAAVVAGGAAVNVLADVAGASLRVLDLAVDADTPAEVAAHKVRRGSGSIDREDALSQAEAEQAFAAGVAVADEEVDSGADLLVPADLGAGNTTPAAVLVAAVGDVEPVHVIGRGSGVDDAAWMRKLTVIRDALRRARRVADDPLRLLATVGGADLAATTGFLVQAAVRRTPVVLDGVVSGAAATVAREIAPRSAHWWLAGHRSVEPAHRIALERLGLIPVLDFGMRCGEGAGALVALPILRAAARTLSDMSTSDEDARSGDLAPPAG